MLPLDRLTFGQPHVFQRIQEAAPISRVLELIRSGHAPSDGHTLAGVGAISHHRRQCRRVQRKLAIECGVLVRPQSAPVGHRSLPGFALRRVLAPLDILECCLVRCDQAGARPAFDAHIANRHTAGHIQRTNRRAPVFKDITNAAAGSVFGDDRQNNVFGSYSLAQLTLDVDRECLGLHLHQALCRQHVAHLARADAKRQRAERAVCARVAVTADDCHPRLRDAQLRADHMNDALNVPLDVEQGNAELGAVLAQGAHLRGRVFRPVHLDRSDAGGDGMVHRGEGLVRAANWQPPLPQRGKRLRRGHLMHQMGVNIQDSRRALILGDYMRVPDLLIQRLCHA